MTTTMVLKCDRCGLVLETLNSCACPDDCVLNCCGEPMHALTAQTADSTREKHVPIPAAVQPAEGSKIVVGSTPHPMTEAHRIEWIEVVNGPYVNRKYLRPGEAPEAEFHVKLRPGMILREYCNVHGLWSAEVK